MNEQKNISIRNKRATYDYEILDTYVAGIVLSGTEIKSLRLGKASLTDCYCYFHNGELFVRGMNIAEYHWGSYNNHVPKRDRKLLLQRKELEKLERSLQDKGLTVVGLKLFINERQAANRTGQGTQKLRQARIPQGKGCPPRDGPCLSQVIPCAGTDSYDDLLRPDFR